MKKILSITSYLAIVAALSFTVSNTALAADYREQGENGPVAIEQESPEVANDPSEVVTSEWEHCVSSNGVWWHRDSNELIAVGDAFCVTKQSTRQIETNKSAKDSSIGENKSAKDSSSSGFISDSSLDPTVLW